MGSVTVALALNEAISRLEGRFGARTVVTATVADGQARARRSVTGTSFDRLSGGGIEPGSALAFTGAGTCGKVTLALRAVAGAQCEGGTALWVDPTRSFDPLAAQRAGIDLARILVVRAPTSDAVFVAASSGLRSEGFRLVVVDLGPAFASATSVDDLAPVLPHVRGSTAALVVLTDAPASRLALPTYVFERVAWEEDHGRTAGWAFAIRKVGDPRDERAILHSTSLGRRLVDAGMRTEIRKAAS
jgi:predicted ATP-dependent serine protease